MSTLQAKGGGRGSSEEPPKNKGGNASRDLNSSEQGLGWSPLGMGTGRSFVGAGRARPPPPPPARRGEDAVHGRRSKEKEGRGRPWLHTRTQRRVREGGIKQKLGFLLSDFVGGVGVHWLQPAEGDRGHGSNYTVA